MAMGSGGAVMGAGGGTCVVADVEPAPDMVTFQPSATVATLAGSEASGVMDGVGAAATFANPVGVIVEPQGSVLVADYDGNTVRRVATDGTVTTLTKQPGFVQPFGLGYGKNGDLFVSTDYDPSGLKDAQSGTLWHLDAVGGVATAMAPDMGRARSFAAVPDGRLVVTNYQNNHIYLVDPATGSPTELAGNSGGGCLTFADGVGSAATFDVPYGVVVLSDGRIIVADRSNHRLRAVTIDGTVTTYAGDGGSGTIDGPLLQARFAGPQGLAADSHDNVFVTDSVAHRIRRVGADGTVTTIAGNGVAGWQDGAGADAQFFGQEGIAVTPDGQTIYVADGTSGEGNVNNRIRQITLGQ
jgi:serine/threonine protein kinase, bacterial